MKHEQKDSTNPVHANRDTGSKKPYVKPAFQSEQIFETMALSCGKVNSSQQQCKTSKKAS